VKLCPGWAFLSTNAIAALPNPYTLGQVNPNSDFVNIDHVYEVSLLDGFFAVQVAKGFTCGEITTLFDVVDGATGGTRLNTIFA